MEKELSTAQQKDSLVLQVVELNIDNSTAEELKILKPWWKRMLKL